MQIYCFRLGMTIEFSYCISMNEGLPCLNVLRCWEDRVDIMNFCKKILGEEGFCKIFKDLPKSRLERMIELVNNACEKK